MPTESIVIVRMGKHERLPPKKRVASGSHNAANASPPASRSPVSASFQRTNPFVKSTRTDAVISKVISGTRNKNSGFDGISKRKRVRLDKREKKKCMALAGKLKAVASKESPSVPLEVRAKRDAVKERERKKRQKLEKKRLERLSAAASAPTESKKRRCRSQVAADSAVATAASVSSATSCDASHNLVAEPSAVINNVPSKKMLRKLEMKEKRAAAKAASETSAVAKLTATASFHDKMDPKKRSRASEAAGKASLKGFESKKQQSANDFPYVVDASDHAETPAGDGWPIIYVSSQKCAVSHVLTSPQLLTPTLLQCFRL